MKAGIIEINLQYTFVLHAYVATFDEYMQVIRMLFRDIWSEEFEQIVGQLEARLAKPWSHLDESRPAWMDTRLLGDGNPALLQLTPSDRISARENVVLSCEEFVIAHELSHHLLGHTVSRSNRAKAITTVNIAIDHLNIATMLQKMNNIKRQEVQADILAFMIMADAIDGPAEFMRLYEALIGSVISLVALAHISETWIETDCRASHAGFVDRIEIIAQLAEWLAGYRPRGAHGDHPLGLLTQLCGFVAITLNAWLHRMFQERSSALTSFRLPTTCFS